MSRCADEKLIEAVRLYAHLYNTADKNYHDTVMKENAWKEIARTLQSSVAKCKKKWFTIRDRYRKALKKLKTKSGQAGTQTKPYRYAEVLSFLLPFIGERKQLSNIVLVENSEDDQQVLNVDDPPTATETPSPDTEMLRPARDSPSGSVVGRRQQRPHIGTVLQNYFTNKTEKKTDRRPPKDHLTKFFEAMEETVRTFNPQRQVEVKRKISSIVMEHELENVKEATSRFPATPSSSRSTSASSGQIAAEGNPNFEEPLSYGTADSYEDRWGGTLKNKLPRHF